MTNLPQMPEAAMREDVTTYSDADLFFATQFGAVEAPDGDTAEAWAAWYRAPYGTGGEAPSPYVRHVYDEIKKRADVALRAAARRRFPKSAADQEELYGVVIAELLDRSKTKNESATPAKAESDEKEKPSYKWGRAEYRMHLCFEGKETIASLAMQLAGNDGIVRKVTRGTAASIRGGVMTPTEKSARARIIEATSAIELAETPEERQIAADALTHGKRDEAAVLRLSYDADPDRFSLDAIVRDEYEAVDQRLDATLYADKSTTDEHDEVAEVTAWFKRLTGKVITETQLETYLLIARLDDLAVVETREAETAAIEAFETQTEESYMLADELRSRATALRTHDEVASIQGKGRRAVSYAVTRAEDAIFADDELVRTLRRGVHEDRRVSLGEIGRKVAQQLAADSLPLANVDSEGYLEDTLYSYGYDRADLALCQSLKDATAAAMKSAAAKAARTKTNTNQEAVAA